MLNLFPFLLLIHSTIHPSNNPFCIKMFGMMSTLNVNADYFAVVQFRVICFLLCILYALLMIFIKRAKSILYRHLKSWHIPTWRTEFNAVASKLNFSLDI